MSKPKVSIVTITYNHERFIKDAIESFLSQEGDFTYEVIIADDASTDTTQSIIRDYAKRYPDIIKPILRKKNIGAQANFVDALNNTKGEYIALCEGDDYWTNDQKLQKQLTMLGNDPSIALCFHPVKVVTEDKDDFSFFPEVKSGFTLNNLLGRNFIQTNSVMYRRLKSYKNFPTNIIPCDWYMHLLHAREGKIGFIDKPMSVYRRHPNGMWWGSDGEVPDSFWKKHGVSHMAMYGCILNIFKYSPHHKDIIIQNADKLLRRLSLIDQSHATNLIEKVIYQEPELIIAAINFYTKALTGLEQHTATLEHESRRLNSEVVVLKHRLGSTERELALIKSSRAWKARNALAKLIGKQPI